MAGSDRDEYRHSVQPVGQRCHLPSLLGLIRVEIAAVHMHGHPAIGHGHALPRKGRLGDGAQVRRRPERSEVKRGVWQNLDGCIARFSQEIAACLVPHGHLCASGQDGVAQGSHRSTQQGVGQAGRIPGDPSARLRSDQPRAQPQRRIAALRAEACFGIVGQRRAGRMDDVAAADDMQVRRTIGCGLDRQAGDGVVPGRFAATRGISVKILFGDAQPIAQQQRKQQVAIVEDVECSIKRDARACAGTVRRRIICIGHAAKPPMS